MIYSAEDSGAPHRLGGCVGHTARATPPGPHRPGRCVGRGAMAQPNSGERVRE